MGLDMYLDEVHNIPMDWNSGKHQDITVSYCKRGENTPTEHHIKDAVEISARMFYWRNFHPLHDFIADNYTEEGGYPLRPVTLDGEYMLEIREFCAEKYELWKNETDDELEYYAECADNTVKFIDSLENLKDRSFKFYSW